MTRCPFCGALGVKLADEVHLQELTWRLDYCGRCGKNWPKDLSARVEADGLPPAEDIPIAPPVAAGGSVVPFTAKVAQLVEGFKKERTRDWKQAQAGERE